MQSAPTPSFPTWPQLFAAGGLIALGVWLGTKLVQNNRRALGPRRSAPVGEIDRWANEGGAVAPPAFPIPKPKPSA